MCSTIRRRAAIDVGSGMIKMMIADVDMSSQRILTQVCSAERPVPFAIAWKAQRSAADGLPADVRESGLRVLRDLHRAIAEHRTAEHPICDNTDIIAVGTEIFRKASNGREYLQQVRDKTGISVQVISQETEAQIGYLTGKASVAILPPAAGGSPCADIQVPESLKPPNLIVYDSGGGSFQITKQSKESMQAYMKAYACGPAFADLMALKGLASGADWANHSPNPCTPAEAEALIQTIKRAISATDGDAADADVPSWLKGGQEVLAISGINGLVRLASDVLDGQVVFTPEELRTALFEKRDSAGRGILGETDEYLQQAYCSYENAEGPHLIVPKLCLLVAVVEHLRLSKLHWRQCIGSCPGLLVWEP